MMLAADLMLDLPDLGREEFDRRAAFGAHHVVMTAPIVLVLKARDAIVECHFAGQPAIRQQLQRAIYGGETDALIFLLDQAMELVGGKMLACLQKCAQNGVALAGLLQSYAAEMLQEDALCLAQIFARDAGLIVDTLLKHVHSAKVDGCAFEHMITAEDEVAPIRLIRPGWFVIDSRHP